MGMVWVADAIMILAMEHPRSHIHKGCDDMSVYYAVERATDHLAHYGVKGMKWGVRRAKSSGNMASLVGHYQRAQMKSKTLRERTSRKAEKANAKSYAAGGATLLGASALGGLASYGLIKGQISAQRKAFPKSRTMTLLHPVGLYGTTGLAAIGGAASLGKAAASAYRSTKRGNAKAVKKYQKFRSEMNRQFDKKTVKNVQKYLKAHPEYRLNDISGTLSMPSQTTYKPQKRKSR